MRKGCLNLLSISPCAYEHPTLSCKDEKAFMSMSWQFPGECDSRKFLYSVVFYCRRSGIQASAKGKGIAYYSGHLVHTGSDKYELDVSRTLITSILLSSVDLLIHCNFLETFSNSIHGQSLLFLSLRTIASLHLLGVLRSHEQAGH